MANKKTKKTSNSYWMKFGGSNSSNLPAYRRYENGGLKMPDDHPVTPPTEEQSKKSKGELFERDLTGIRRYDRVGTKEEQEALKYMAYSSTDSKSQWEHSQKTVEAKLKAGTFWGWPIDKWGGGKREMGGPNLPQYNKGGYATGGGNRSDYSGVNDRNTNTGTAVGQPVGDSNALQYLDYWIPGMGTAADFLVDLWGFKGEQKQYQDNLSDANKSAGTLDVIDRPDANKGTLDLSTRKDALAAQVNFTQQEPTFGNYVAPRALQTAGAGVGRYAAGQMGSMGGGGGGAVDTGGIGAEDLAGSLDLMANYGGAFGGRMSNMKNMMTGPTELESGMDLRNKTKMNYGGPGMGPYSGDPSLSANFDPGGSEEWAGGTEQLYPGQQRQHLTNGSVISPFNPQYVPGHQRGGTQSSDGGDYVYANNNKGRYSFKNGGQVDFESGMDLNTLSKAAFGRGGGALNLGPGAGDMGLGAMSGARNPYGNQSMMMATGMAGEQTMNTGGAAPQQYEAEGGEVIMHEPGSQPGTTGEMEAIGGNEMISKLEGSSHNDGGEVVEGDGEQYVFSNTLKSEKWGKISFSDAAEKIAKNIAKYEENLEEGDDITKSTAESMIQAWQQKLGELREEQEGKREEKFMEMVNSGADKETLMQNFPDLTEQMMAQQAMAGQQEQEQMQQENPMGDIDMSALSPEDQQLIGARYGLPHMNHGGSHDDFEPYDFNTYANNIIGMGKENNFDLGNDYTPSRSDLLESLTLNFPEEGFFNKDKKTGKQANYMTADAAYEGLMSDFSKKRSAHIEEATGLKGKPNRSNYRTKDEVSGKTSWNEGGQAKMSQDEAAWKMYNSGLGMNWSDNYGADAGISERKYYKAFYNDLIAKGTDADLAKTLTEKEKLKKVNLDAANLETATEEAELTDVEKAARLIEEQQAENNQNRMLGDIGNTLINMSPTAYNFAKGNEDAEVEQFQRNKNEDEVEGLLRGNTVKDVSQELQQNEDTFNNLKYLARDASDGSSANAMNTLLRGQIFKQDADAATYEAAEESNNANRMLLADYLNKSGETDRGEEIRRTGINSQNKAAVEAFKAKGWEGLSGANQLKEQMNNQVNRDEQLKGLLDDIYPDVHLYKTETGGVDLEGLIKAHPELSDQLREYFKK